MTQQNYKFVSKGYLYRFTKDHMTETKGEVWSRDAYVSGINVLLEEKTYFRIYNDTGELIKRMQCKKAEGDIHNLCLWLKEPDRATAAKLFIDSEKARIAQLVESIQKHNKNISILAKELN